MKQLSLIGIALLFVSACADPLEKPAKESQLESFKTVLEMYPEIESDYAAAESDGVVTKGELLEMAEKAKAIRKQRESAKNGS